MPTPQTEYRYPCENCGASLRFQPGQDVLVCDYCGHEQRIGEGPGRAGDQPLERRQVEAGDGIRPQAVEDDEHGATNRWGGTEGHGRSRVGSVRQYPHRVSRHGRLSATARSRLLPGMTIR